MPIQWRERFSVGNDLIDADHQYLIEIINKAEAAFLAHNRTLLLDVLGELARYGVHHFEREEAIAKAVGYSATQGLHQSHLDLIQSLSSFKAKIGETWEPEAIGAFTVFLRDWLLVHVIREDMLMKPFLQKYSPRFDPR